MAQNFRSLAPVVGAAVSPVRHGGAVIDLVTEDAGTADGIPASPPPEVRQAISQASTAYDRLQARGHELGFAIEPGTGKVHVEVRNLEGELMWIAPPSKALEVAAGGGL